MLALECSVELLDPRDPDPELPDFCEVSFRLDEPCDDPADAPSDEDVSASSSEDSDFSRFTISCDRR